MSRKIALAAGGTGGHMFPAQALAEEAGRRGWGVILLTDARGLRYAEGFPASEIVELEAANPNVRGLAAKASMAVAMSKGTRRAGRALKSFGPDMVIGFGGYPSAPAMFAAKAQRRPHGIHEQNAVLGRVNRRIAPGADLVAHGFARLDRLSATKGEVVQTGNPVRDGVALARAPFPPPGPEGGLRLLVFGGSQGARLFAKIFPGAVARLPASVRAALHVTHQVPEADRDEAEAAYRAAGVTVEIAPFFKDLPERMAKSHLVVGRAGASSVTELSVLERPSLLVPLGIAMDDHQRANAEVLTAAGAAELIAEPDLDEDRAAAALARLLEDHGRLSAMGAKAAGLVPADAAVRLASLVEGLLERRGRARGT